MTLCRESFSVIKGYDSSINKDFKLTLPTSGLYIDMEFLDVLTEGLERVLMVRGGGREVITIYS